MKWVMAVLGLAVLASCGADGAPEKPELSANTTIGYNSETGSFNKSSITIFFGL